MRVALLFWGLTRSLKLTYPNINDKILNYFNKCKIDYKIYMHTYNFEGLHIDKRTGERIKLDFDEYKLLNPDYIKIDNQDKIKKEIKIEEYLKMRYTYVRKTVENLICGLYSLKCVTKMLVDSEEKYDYIIYLRPDVLFKSSLPLQWFGWVNDNRFLVPLFASCNGINDRFAILTPKLALKYGNRLDRIREYYEFIKGQRISSERFLHWVMREHKPKKINYLFKRVRGNGLICDKDKKLF